MRGLGRKLGERRSRTKHDRTQANRKILISRWLEQRPEIETGGVTWRIDVKL